MAKGREKPRDDAPRGPGKWIVTFSDCMTLLLCFFVLLLTFSSFDEVELQKLAGAFDTESHDSIFPNPREIKDSSVPPVPRVVHITDTGSEMPTRNREKNDNAPKVRPPILDDDVYKDRKTFFIPSRWLFWGEGTVLTPEGRDYLRRIAGFLDLLPSRVVIAESTGGLDAGEAPDEARLARAAAVMRFLAAAGETPPERFNVSACDAEVPPRFRGHRVLAVTLIAGKVY